MEIKDIYNKHVSFVKVKGNGEVKYCPPKEIDATSLHPRVALRFLNDKAKCPYCSLEYRIETKSE
jgi:uncharacterized Zn-finger protein